MPQALQIEQAENDLDENLDRIEGVTRVINGRQSEPVMPDAGIVQQIADLVHADEIG